MARPESDGGIYPRVVDELRIGVPPALTIPSGDRRSVCVDDGAGVILKAEPLKRPESLPTFAAEMKIQMFGHADRNFLFEPAHNHRLARDGESQSDDGRFPIRPKVLLALVMTSVKKFPASREGAHQFLMEGTPLAVPSPLPALSMFWGN
jgi:hypothetical protein